MPERIDDLLASWRIELEAADKAPRTITLYADTVHAFVRWLEAQDRPATVDEITKHVVTRWLADVRDGGAAANTLLLRHKQLHRFVRWLVAEGELEVDPMAALELPRPQMTPVPILTDDELTALLRTTAGVDFADRRDHAIMRLLFDCGLRIGEIVGIDLVDVDLRTKQVTVTGKGRKTRVVPFGTRTAQALDRYIRTRRQHRYAHESRLFLSQRGPMSRDGVDDRLRVRARQAGVEQLHAHRFRHTFADRWLAAGGEGRDLMKLAGWSSDAMLDRYAASNAEQRARDAHRRLRLGDKL